MLIKLSRGGMSLGRHSRGESAASIRDRQLICREAACRQHGNEQNDAMNAFHNAAKSYKKTNPEGKLRQV